jgi:predicted lipoprotein with Yx(FWY)xxD motif/plastocyanin
MLALVLVAVPLLLASTVSLAQDATPTPDPTVFVRQDPELGPFLSDAAGMTLYLFTNDTTPGESTCYDQCAENWPIFTAEEPLTLPNGVDGELTLITRTDGTTQVAYNGIPLYYFVGDEQPGDTNGQGRGDVWYVVAPGAQFGVLATPVASPAATDAGTPVAAGEVLVILEEFAVVVSSRTFAVGQEYTFTVRNAGEFQHEFVIEPVGSIREAIEAGGQVAAIDVIEPGTTASLTFTFTEPGLYQFACHFRSHYPQGMAVTVLVV